MGRVLVKGDVSISGSSSPNLQFCVTKIGFQDLSPVMKYLLVYVASYLFCQIWSCHNGADPHQFPLLYKIGQIFTKLLRNPKKGTSRIKKIQNIS